MHIRRQLGRAAAVLPLLVASPIAASSAAHAAGSSSGAAALTQAEIAALSGNATQHVIVELAATPADGTDAGHADRHAAEVHDAQAPVLDELRKVDAKGVRTFDLLPAVAATVTPAEAAHLATRSDVAAVVPDTVVHLRPHSAAASTPTTSSPGGAGGTTGCSTDPAHPVQDEYLQTMHVGSSAADAETARSLGIDGSGVKVGFIADAIDPANADFVRPDGSHVVVDAVDFTGGGYSAPTDGAEAYIDSSAIAAQGRAVHDIGSASSQPFGPRVAAAHCYIQVQGVAPGASLVDLNVFGGNNAYNSVIAQAIDYATYTDKVQVLNESFGGNSFPDTGAIDLTRQANDNAIAAGVTVVTSTGDAGIANTQGTPSTDPKVISVGASTTYQLFTATGYGGAQFAPNGYQSDNISTISSSGTDSDGRTIDVVAPGELNWTTCTADPARFSGCTNFNGAPSDLIDGGGTSQSSPLTAGAAALVIQAYAKTHGGATPSPALVKQLIVSSARDLGAPGDQQGAGEVDAYRAVLAAEQAGNALTVSSGQLDVLAGPSTTQDLTETVTNSSATPQTVTVSSRTLGTPSTIASGAATLEEGKGTTTDYAGGKVNTTPVAFQVPAGADRLVVDLAYTSDDPYASGVTSSDLRRRVRLSLIDPTGRLASYDLPQGNGNHDYAQVTAPAAGTWTAIIWSRTKARGGTVGTVLYRAQVARFTGFGTVTPSSLTLRPGQSSPVRLRVTTPDMPGDQTGSLVLRTDTGPDFARTSTVPVVLRSVASVSKKGASSFTGTLLGGNGRAYFTGQSAFYQLDVGRVGALNADIELQGPPTGTFFAVLVDPSGQAQATASNTLVDGSGASTDEPGAQLHVLAPAAGRWRLEINFYNQVSGSQIDEPYLVTLNSTPVPVDGSALPSNNGFKVAPGSTVTVPVTVTNNGASPEEYFVDARLDSGAVLPLAAQGPSRVTAPGGLAAFVVPSHTTALAYGASASRPLVAEASWTLGDPDLRAQPSTTSIGVYAPQRSAVPAGPWFVIPALQGPFSGPVTPVQADVAMVAATQAFDPAVSAPTGDLWALSTDPSAQVAPVVVQPGKSATIPVTFTVSGPSHTKVSGTLYVGAAQLGAESSAFGAQALGNDVAALPYRYSIR